MENTFNKLLQKSKIVSGHKSPTIRSQIEALENTAYDIPDVYGTGEVINDFEDKMASVLGTEGAVFFPSGTMAQQIALRIWCDRNGLQKVAYHPFCHLEIYEEDGLKTLHRIKPILLGEEQRLFTIEDLKELEDVSVVLFELPQREIGGQLPSWDELVEMTTYCKERGFRTHLDGARLFECLPFYNKTASEVAGLFDSSYISFYKGLGGVTGAILAGDNDFLKESKVWKRRHGGDLYRLYPYIITSDASYEARSNKVKEYYKSACTYAEMLQGINGLKVVPEIPVTNMFHIYFEGSEEEIASKMIEVMNATGIALIPHIRYKNAKYMSEISIGDMFDEIGKEEIKKAVNVLKRIMD